MLALVQTFGTVSKWRKFDILTNFLILLKDHSFHNQWNQFVLSAGRVHWGMKEPSQKMGTASPCLGAAFWGDFLTYLPSSCSNESFWMSHGVMPAFIHEVFKEVRKSTDTVKVSIEGVTLVLHCFMWRPIWVAPPTFSSEPLPHSRGRDWDDNGSVFRPSSSKDFFCNRALARHFHLLRPKLSFKAKMKPFPVGIPFHALATVKCWKQASWRGGDTAVECRRYPDVCFLFFPP